MTTDDDITRTPKTHCTQCGYTFTAYGPAVAGNNPKPRPGDITMCLNCGHVQAFNDQLTFRELTKDEALEVALDEHVQEMQRRRLFVMNRRKH